MVTLYLLDPPLNAQLGDLFWSPGNNLYQWRGGPTWVYCAHGAVAANAWLELHNLADRYEVYDRLIHEGAAHYGDY